MKIKGATLIELVIFIVLFAIAATSITPIITVLTYTSRVDRGTKAVEVAQQRMELILLKRYVSGFDSLSDPCAGGTPPAACTSPAGYTVNSSIATGWDGSNDYKTITVTVSGNGYATLKRLVAKYF